ncbi:MAG: DedA family protein [Bacteroidaceae bacterium]|nr:DedA family protein [Bacteroidaceae bacterium]MBR1788124.1 DedA family protein [Bacteroidaceae bacterium]
MQSLPFIAWCLEHLNYWVITLLMAIESSFIPFPSEVVVPPAAYLAAHGDNGLNVFLVVVCATVGALIGALVNYALALYLGRPIVYKFANSRLGHICLIDQEKVEMAEQYFDRHGAIGTFVGRLVPAVRQLISIPAGLSRMSMGRFLLYTTMGAGLWNSILAAIGYYLASVVPYEELDATVAQYSVYLKVAMLLLGAFVVVYLIYKGLKK